MQVPRAVHAYGLHREHHQDSGAPPQTGRGLRGERHLRAIATTAGTWPTSWRSTRARSCSRPPVSELADVAMRCCRLRERMQTRLFLRKDMYGKYVSCLVYLSRDGTTRRSGSRCRTSSAGRSTAHSSTSARWSEETPIARLHIVVRAEPGEKLVDANLRKLEQAVAAAVRSWDDDLIKEAVSQLGEGPGPGPARRVQREISETYKADVPAVAAVLTWPRSCRCGTGSRTSRSRCGSRPGMSAAFRWSTRWRPTGPSAGVTSAGSGGSSIHRNGPPITLTDVLPRLQHMGVEVVDEHPYQFGDAASRSGSTTSGCAGTRRRWPRSAGARPGQVGARPRSPAVGRAARRCARGAVER